MGKLRKPSRKSQTCTKCKKRKVLSSFRILNPGYLDSWCKKCFKEYQEQYRKNYYKKWRKYSQTRDQKLKQEVIKTYGGKCKCCGETISEFLTIDCKKNGVELHKKFRYGTNFYRWLKKHNYPKRNFQLLCMNCNFAKGMYGKCPHKMAFKQ